MCGICGKYSADGVSEEDVRRMADAIVHRGPDDQGFFVQGPIGLGSRRLSIIDLASGRMPIANEDGSIHVVFNGEIYNFQELTRDLEQQGHRFQTRTDTEVIVHLYERYGERCVEKLRGMFAFALWDANRQKLLLARDRIGQKPLFYAEFGSDFYFASEPKAILAAGVPARMDAESVHHYLSLRFIPSPKSIFEGIRKLPPAHYLVLENGKPRIERYWSVSFRNKIDMNEEDLLDALEEHLTEAVQTHLMSDVGVGAFLSGGMDSSMVVALMSKTSPAPFQTFAVGVEEQDFDELPYARIVADHFHVEHIEERVQADLIGLLPSIVRHLDEPSDPIAACMFHAARLASRHVKVVLGGDGGDELFAGFDRYMGLGYIDHYAAVPLLLRQRLLGPILEAVPDSFTYKSLTQKLRWMHELSLTSDAGQRYAEATCFFRFNHGGKSQLYGDAWNRTVGTISSSDVIANAYHAADADDPIDKMLYADVATRLPEHSLMLTDRMTMAHSLEARSPFLDHKLVEFLAAVPSRMKIRKGKLKYILRKLAESHLPESITRRKKQGFMFPVAYWFKNELYPMLSQVLLNSTFVREGIFRADYVRKLLEDHRSNRVDNHVRLWMLLNLEVWHRMYVDGENVEHVGDSIQRTMRDTVGSVAASS